VEEVVDPLGRVVICLSDSVNSRYGPSIRVVHLRLGKLVVMMREEEINSSRVDIHAIT